MLDNITGEQGLDCLAEAGLELLMGLEDTLTMMFCGLRLKAKLRSQIKLRMEPVSWGWKLWGV